MQTDHGLFKYLLCHEWEAYCFNENSEKGKCVNFLQAIPLYSVMVGRYNGTSKIRIATSAEVDNPKRVEFDTPSKENPLTQGEPKWANYVKGVLHHFSRESRSPPT